MSQSIQCAWLKAGKGLLPPRALPGKVWGGTKSMGTVGGKMKNRRAMKIEQTNNGNGTEKGMLLMMTKMRMEKTWQGRSDEKRWIIVSGIRMAKKRSGEGP